MVIYRSYAADVNTIPDGFLIGSATAAYQVEGAWNISGKGEGIWDRMVYTHPEWIADGSTGDVAADSYHHYKEDIQALKDMGMQHYRFSISWTRILPTGDITNVNQDGIDYYNALINELLDNNIIPLVTIYHWNLPQPLQDLGGWVNPIIVDYFEDFARLVFTEFGDRVKWWITLNEPYSFTGAYGGYYGLAPNLNFTGVGDFLAAHNALKAHARAYHVYDEEFREKQNGKVSITLDIDYAIPKTDSEEDKRAAETAMQFTLGWFAHPIYSEEGDYPAVMKERIANLSKAEGRYRSRLPEFDDYWREYIRGTYDYFGVNHYTSYLASYNDSDIGYGYNSERDPNWPHGATYWMYSVPVGMRDLMNWITKEYNRPDIFITENGWGDTGGLNDTMRTEYYNSYLAEILKAIHIDNASVIGYTAWSLIDNFEWISGYTVKFGLYEVDFDDPERPRTAKDSSKALAEIIRTKQVHEEYFKDVM